MKTVKALFLSTLLITSGSALAGETAGQMVDDTMIQSEVKAKLVADSALAGMGVNLETRKGVVQLGGFMDAKDMDKGRKFAEIAASVDGVKKVDNQLHAKSPDRSAGKAIDDGVATTRVKAAIASAEFGDAVSINIDTYNGVMLLTGFADTEASKKRAGELAAADANVSDVINGIYVMP